MHLHPELELFLTCQNLWIRFIVLQHDVHYSAVELATGYTLDSALKHDPHFNLQPIGQCLGYPTSNLYVETTKNTTFPSPKTKESVSGAAENSTGTSGSGSNSALAAGAPFAGGLLSVLGLLVTLL